jgi:hypothetical protein
MSKHGKKYLKAAQEVVHGVQLPIREGLQRVKKLAYAAFDETVGVSVNLGIDASKGEHATRGSVLLPHVKFLFLRRARPLMMRAKQEQTMLGQRISLKKLTVGGWTLIMQLRIEI